MTPDTDFTPAEQATWDAMKAEQPLPEPKAADPAPVEAPAAAAPEPTPAAEPVAAKPAADEVERIPLSVLLEERKEFRQRLAELNARFQTAQPKPAPAPEPAIDPNDHVGLLKHTAAKLAAIEAERQEQAELSQIADFGMRHAAEFKKAAPDFDEAYNHLRVSRAQQLMESGADPQQVAQILRGEEANILRMCAQMNVNPATFVYNLALGAGYARAAPAVSESVAPAIAATAAPAVTPPRDDTGKFVKAKVEMAAKGHERAANPVAGAGAGTGGPLDLRALAALEGDDFDKATSGKNWEKIWRNA